MRFISGEIINTSPRVLFSSSEDSHLFCFMLDPSVDYLGEVISIPCENKLAFGQTFDHRQIAIYTGTDTLELYRDHGFHTSAYILSKNSCSQQKFRTFNTICFYGGTVKKVFKPQGLKIQPGRMLDTEKDAVPAKLHSDNKCYTVDLKDDGIATINIGSTVKFTSGEFGNQIDNSEVILRIGLSKPQPIHKFFSHYQAVIAMLRFMTFRQNVVFDRITIGDIGDKDGYFCEDAEVHIEKEGNVTNKEYFRCIGIKDLGDSFPELVRIAYAIPGQNEKGEDL